MTKKYTPLVSIVVITYNSSQTLLETLESCLLQNFNLKLIELIISDDASTDSTTETANNWLKMNGSKFSTYSLISSYKNTGISENCNRGWRKANGTWIKTIAGDDILLPNCIKENIDFITKNPSRVVFSKIIPFRQDVTKKILLSSIPRKSQLNFFERTAKQQLNHLILCNVSGTPSCFIEKKLLTEVGFANTDFSMIEDYPLWLKITNSNNKIHFLNEATVLYRLQDSASRSTTKIANIKHLEEMREIEKYILEHHKKKLSPLIRIRKKFWAPLAIYFVKLTKNKRGITTRTIFFIILSIKPLYFKSEIWPTIKERLTMFTFRTTR